MGQIVVAVDGMGGDHAPGEIVQGCIDAVAELPGVKILLVGAESVIQNELEKRSFNGPEIEVVPATQVISTEESPTSAIRNKKDSSMVVGLNLVKNKVADAFVSAGSTGALLTGATLLIGRIPGIDRPALGTCLPDKKGFTFLLDSGANVDCKPQYLVQFAKMGSAYAEYVLGIPNPKIGLVNIGTEKDKGNALTKETYGLLEESEIHFIGNIEARSIPFGEADVVVCDGFVGNTILKFGEGLSVTLLGIIKQEITAGFYKLVSAALHSPFKKIKKRFDADEVGGAPFLGLKSLVVKAHGSSKAKAFKNAVAQCKKFVEAGLVEKIQEKL